MITKHFKTRISISALIALITVFVPIGSGSPRQDLQLFTTSCGADGEIPASDRSAPDQAAMGFVQNALGPNPEAAYASFTDDAKSNVNIEQFTSVVKLTIQTMAPFKDLHIAHTYLSKVTGGTQVQSVVCGNLSSPADWVAVTTKPGPAQAHVIVEGQTLNNTWAFVVWLTPEQGIWRVLHFQPAISATVGKTSEDLERMAETEIQRNHDFNAFILSFAALQLTERGPNLQLGIQPEIEKAFKNLRPPHEMQPPAPFIWQFGGAQFKVLNVGLIGIGGKIYLQIDHELDAWGTNEELDKKNHELISAFVDARPEYKYVFSGLVVRAHERGGSRGFASVSENELAQE
jgi:hypothetical protein